MLNEADARPTASRHYARAMKLVRDAREAQSSHAAAKARLFTPQVTILGSGSSNLQRVPSALGVAIEAPYESAPPPLAQSASPGIHFPDPPPSVASTLTRPPAPPRRMSFYPTEQRIPSRYTTQCRVLQSYRFSPWKMLLIGKEGLKMTTYQEKN